ncbi:hypothetical protein DFH06DRAFT_676172 [Mycena polygramma]|nr:hypothetical protein DFH06DRAFT_676172 [Mycena polygramma]
MTLPDWCKIPKTKSPAFLRDSVRCVALLMMPKASVVSLLSSCSRISRLALWHIQPEPTTLPLIASMPLLRLSADLALFGPPGVDFGRPILNQLTHLDTFSKELSANTCTWDVIASSVYNQGISRILRRWFTRDQVKGSERFLFNGGGTTLHLQAPTSRNKLTQNRILHDKPIKKGRSRINELRGHKRQ